MNDSTCLHLHFPRNTFYSYVTKYKKRVSVSVTIRYYCESNNKLYLYNPKIEHGLKKTVQKIKITIKIDSHKT